jgi:hypothetical protein
MADEHSNLNRAAGVRWREIPSVQEGYVLRERGSCRASGQAEPRRLAKATWNVVTLAVAAMAAVAAAFATSVLIRH